MRKVPGDKVGFARIREFKGIESEAFVVVGLPASDEAARTSAEHYVAMSRLQYAAKGQGMLTGLAILFCAMVIDRIVQGHYKRSTSRHRPGR